VVVVFVVFAVVVMLAVTTGTVVGVFVNSVVVSPSSVDAGDESVCVNGNSEVGGTVEAAS
jgi:hypothetical protein